MSTFNIITLTYEENVAILTINQPKTMNALSTEVLEEIGEALTQVDNNLDCRVLVVTGAGEKSFVAGANFA